MKSRTDIAAALLAASLLAGCSPRSIMVNSLGDAVARGSVVYQTDGDPQLVGDALPFALKMMESLLVEAPKNENLLVAAAQGFTQYAHAYVEMEAFRIEPDDPAGAREIRARAKGLFLRARGYGFRALELEVASFRERLDDDPASTLASFDEHDVPALYWTAAAWASAIAADKTDLDLAADLPLIEPIVERCLQLDEDYDAGALHEFMMLFKGSLSDAGAGDPEAAHRHYERAMELAAGKRISPLVSYAETIAVKEQDEESFRLYLKEALSFDPDEAPENRLANVIAQERARILLDRIDDYFL